MTLSMHQASAPMFVYMLRSLDRVLQVAEAEVAAGRVGEAELMEARLAPDMFPLPRQVQIATDGVKGGLARLAGEEPPAWADDETTLAELRARVAKAIAFIDSVPAQKVDGSEDKPIHLSLMGGAIELDFIGRDFLLNFVTPNFYFHVTTAYDILRHKGVPLSKRDFLGGGQQVQP